MPKYKPSQCARMVINPYEERNNIFEAYPQLKEVASQFEEEDITWDSLFRYLSLVYDLNSPAIKEYPDVRQRKIVAAKEVGYKMPDDPKVAQLHHFVAVTFICSIVRNKIWELVCNMDFVWDEYTTKLNTLITIVDEPEKELKAVELKNKMIQQQGEMLGKREALLKRLFDDDTELIDIEASLATPEAIARKVGKIMGAGR